MRKTEIVYHHLFNEKGECIEEKLHSTKTKEFSSHKELVSEFVRFMCGLTCDHRDEQYLCDTEYKVEKDKVIITHKLRRSTYEVIVIAEFEGIIQNTTNTLTS